MDIAKSHLMTARSSQLQQQSSVATSDNFQTTVTRLDTAPNNIFSETENCKPAALKPRNCPQ